jgi:hypothetical protein
MASAATQTVSLEAHSEATHAMRFPRLGGSIDDDPIDWLEEISQTAADRMRMLRRRVIDTRGLMPDTENFARRMPRGLTTSDE